VSVLASLIACAGTWRGTNTLQDPSTNTPQDSASTAVITPVLGGRFVRMDYTWRYHGAPQEGSLLIGFDPREGALTAHWIDTWHMGNKVMVCRGAKPDGAVMSFRGLYAAPPGPDWGWRVNITTHDDGTMHVVMLNIWPDGGREDVAVQASYTRA
jgi:hypothetical protein